MRAYKQRQYLVFELGMGQNFGVVKYDLAKNTWIGKRGNPVSSVAQYFPRMSIDHIIERFDEPYQTFLKKVRRDSTRRIRNIGTFLEMLSHERYKKAESYIVAGLDYSYDAPDRLSEVPKRVVKYAREKGIPISATLIRNITEFENVRQIAKNGEWQRENFAEDFIHDVMDGSQMGDYLHDLIELYNYEPKALVRYIHNLVYFQYIVDDDGDNLRWNWVRPIRQATNELKDYAQMAHAIHPDFQKYPKYFVSEFRTTKRNYNRLKIEFDQEIFSKRIRLDYEFKHGDYIITYPKHTEEIKREGSILSHCVASYIKNVINGQTHILFLRKKEEPDTPCITIEVKNGQINQALGHFNRRPDEKEGEVLDKYREYLKKQSTKAKA